MVGLAGSRSTARVTLAAGESEGDQMPRIDCTFDTETMDLLDQLAQELYDGNTSLTLRAAIESLAMRLGLDGSSPTGDTPVGFPREGELHAGGVGDP
jgi:hypothetical protein